MNNIKIGDIVEVNGNYRIVYNMDDEAVLVKVVDDRELCVFKCSEVTKPSLEEKIDFILESILYK